MCNFFSGVITKNKNIVDYDTDSHEELIKKAGLEDTTPSPDFVRVELLPIDEDIFNHSLKNWKLKVDQDFRPDWFEEKWAESEMKQEIKKVWKERFIVGDESWKKLKGGRFWVKGSKVVAMGNSSVVAWGKSSVEARENSSVVARDNSSVVIPYSEKVKIKGIYDNASVKDLSGNPVIYVANKDIELKVFKNK